MVGSGRENISRQAAPRQKVITHLVHDARQSPSVSPGASQVIWIVPCRMLDRVISPASRGSGGVVGGSMGALVMVTSNGSAETTPSSTVSVNVIAVSTSTAGAMKVVTNSKYAPQAVRES